YCKYFEIRRNPLFLFSYTISTSQKFFKNAFIVRNLESFEIFIKLVICIDFSPFLSLIISIFNLKLDFMYSHICFSDFPCTITMAFKLQGLNFAISPPSIALSLTVLQNQYPW